jgi:hypothetical protein
VAKGGFKRGMCMEIDMSASEKAKGSFDHGLNDGLVCVITK